MSYNPIYARQYRITHKERLAIYDREYQKRNRVKLTMRNKIRRSDNPAKFIKWQKDWRRNHSVNVRKTQCKYARSRRARDINFKIRAVLRARLSKFLLMKKDNERSRYLLGCSIEDFRIYLESKFEPGMSWSNYGRGIGKWNIDHIMPCSIFDLAKHEHIKRCFHFSNMQPLWFIENLRKSNKLEHSHI